MSSVRKVKIPKPDGGTRILRVLTTVDCMIQQAVVQILVYMYEPTFYDLGFRPGKSVYDAVTRAKSYMEKGCGKL